MMPSIQWERRRLRGLAWLTPCVWYNFILGCLKCVVVRWGGACHVLGRGVGVSNSEAFLSHTCHTVFRPQGVSVETKGCKIYLDFFLYLLLFLE